MSALDKLRQQAERAATALQNAQTKHDAEVAAARERNSRRRRAHWQATLEQDLPAAVEDQQAAHAAFRAAVAAGDGGEVLTRWLAYVRAFQYRQQLNNATAAALATLSADNTLQYAAGASPSHQDLPDFGAEFAKATKAAGDAHTAEALAAQRQPLTAQLEPEPDQ